MPTYQYRCTECDHSVEVVQRFSDEPLTVCPTCSGRLRKVFSPVGVVFKGSGFYKTDSRSSGSRAPSVPAAETKSGAGEAAAKAAKDGSSEAKPAGGADGAKPAAGAEAAKPAKGPVDKVA